jgi:hypothetical protein
LPFDPWALPTAIECHACSVNTRSLPLPVLTSLPTAIQFHAGGVMMAWKRNFSLDDLSNSGPAVRLYGEGRANGPPKDKK